MIKQEEAVVVVAPENEMNKDYEIKIEEMTDEQILSYLIEKRNLTKLDSRVEKHKEPILTNKWVCFDCGDDSIQYSANAWFDYNTDEFKGASDSTGREIWCDKCNDSVDIIGQDYFYNYPEWVISFGNQINKFRKYEKFEKHIFSLALGDKTQTEILDRYEGEQKDFADYGTFTIQVILNDDIEE